jgi:hypothetical protein
MDFADAAIMATERAHEACGQILESGGFGIYQHGVAETFRTLTGGRQSLGLAPSLAVEVMAENYLPESTGTALAAARKAEAARLYTPNPAHFPALRRERDPDNEAP